MKKKHRPLLYLGIAVLIAAATYIAERPNEPRVSDTSVQYFIPEFDRANVARVEIEQFLDGAELRRDGKNWLVAERVTPAKAELLAREGATAPEPVWKPADHTRVMSALSSFGGLEEGLSVSANPENQRLYQVDRAGVAVRGFDAQGKAIFDVVVGRNGPDLVGTYMRRAGEDRVWLVNRPIVGAFSPVASDWVTPSQQPETR